MHPENYETLRHIEHLASEVEKKRGYQGSYYERSELQAQDGVMVGLIRTLAAENAKLNNQVNEAKSAGLNLLDALQQLWRLKLHKNTTGKDTYYLHNKPKVWDFAHKMILKYEAFFK